MIVKKQMVAALPDESLRTCLNRPGRRPIKNDNDVAELITDLYAVVDDCISKHKATWQAIDNTKTQVDQFNAAQ